jgi:AcrR family transcriptional regulator
MTPRPYQRAKRQEASDETRARVLDATHEMLTRGDGPIRFSIDAVAKRAGVARMTVYYQFGSKAGLLEAFFDSLVDRGPFRRMPGAMGQADPMRALDQVVAIFGEFWEKNRAAHGRLFAAARLDRELDAAMRQRHERRRGVIRALVERLGRWRGKRGAERCRDLVDALFAVTGFPVFETLAADGRTPERCVAMVQKLARATVEAFKG